MLKIIMKLDDIKAIELMHEKEFELWKLTNKHFKIISVVPVAIS